MTKTRQRRVWIVEMRVENEWQPTAGAAINSEQAKHVIRDWRDRNPDDRFRLVKYVAERDTIL